MDRHGIWQRLSHDFPRSAIHPRLQLARLGLAVLPPYLGSRTRALVMGLAGLSIGRGTVLYGTPTIVGSGKVCARIRFGTSCLVNVGAFLDAEDCITIGDHVSIGQQVMILTTTHDVGPPERRAAFEGVTAPVVVEDGVWIGARAVILPGVVVGRGSIIGAGTVVRKSVPVSTLVVDDRRTSVEEWLQKRRIAGPETQ